MRTIEPSVLLGMIVAVVMLTAGTAVLLGWHTSHLPQQIRIMFGIVMLLLGVYRAVITVQNHLRRPDEDS